MAVILVACRLVGAAARRIGQPQVVGEMIAGVLLGPSLFGWLAPGWQGALFPKDSMDVLYVGAQLGIGLYMFLVGVEFDIEVFRSRARSAFSVSFAGMVVPFLCAMLLAPWLMKTPGLFSERATTFEAVLFLGAAIAITAFPMLSRIIHERGLTGTDLGTLTLAAGAIDDAVAWCVLALVLASFQRLPDGSLDWIIVAKATLGGTFYSVFMLTAGRRIFKPLGALVQREGHLGSAQLGLILAAFCVGAWLMDAVGLHAVFGGFILGLAMPRGALVRQLQEKLEPFTLVFLVPMFFTFSGLQTQFNVVTQPHLLVAGLVILAVSIFGKGIACWAAARWHGEDQRTALAVGTLMNARGMMELIIANIGLQLGVIKPSLFAMLVFMAIVTTLMATPLFELVYGRHVKSPTEIGRTPAQA